MAQEKRIQIPVELVARADEVLAELKKIKDFSKGKMEVDFIKKGSLKEDQVQIDRLIKKAEAFRKTLDNPDPKNAQKIASEYTKLLQGLENISSRDWSLEFDLTELRKGNKEIQTLLKDIEELKAKVSGIKIEPIKLDSTAEDKIKDAKDRLRGLKQSGPVPGGGNWSGLKQLEGSPDTKSKVKTALTGIKGLGEEDLKKRIEALQSARAELTGQKGKGTERTVVDNLIKQIQEYIENIKEAKDELDKLQGEGSDKKKVQSFSSKAAKYLEEGRSVQELRKLAEKEGIINLTEKTGEISKAKSKQTGFENSYRGLEANYVKALEDKKQVLGEIEQKQEKVNQVETEAIAKEQNYSDTIKGTVNGIKANVEGENSRISAIQSTSNEITKAGQQFDKVRQTIARYTGTYMIFMQLRKVVRQAWQDIKELDQQLNEISIVTGKTMDELWGGFGKVNAVAQEFGVTASNVVSVQNLYYHQGRSVAEVNQLTAETLTLAKISGLEYADATDKMTAALNAYNIAAEDSSRVTDVTAALASNAATSTEELMNALTKTASIAANAGMSIESTEVFLTKMIETTRESSENLGTALKTITARFTEMKSAVDVDEDGVVADFNKVETALKKAGVSLKDSSGSFRDIDDVFMDLSKAWDTLDRNTQRYIATQAAGSRQQSRFIAMIEDYDRTLELTKIAQDSAGTGAIQLARSQESIETAINKLKSSWQEFYTKVLNGNVFKGVISAANKLVNWLNEGNTTLKATLVILGSVIAVKAAQAALDAAELAFIKAKTGLSEQELSDSKKELLNKTQLLLIEKRIRKEKEGQVVASKLNIKESAKQGFLDGAKGTKGLGIGKIGSKIGNGAAGLLSGLASGAGVLGGALTTLLPIISVALPVAILAGSVAWATFGKDMVENAKLTKKAEESIKSITSATDKYQTSLNETKNLTEKYNTYLELLNKGTARSTEENEQFINVQNELASLMPQMVDYYNGEGDAILKNREELEKLVEAKKEQVEINRQIQQTAIRTGATAGVLAEGTAAGSSFKSMTETAAGLSNTQYQKYTTAGSGLRDKEVKEGLEYLTSAKAFNAITFGKLTGDTVNTKQFNEIAKAVQEAGKDEEDPAKKAQAQRDAFKKALEESGEYSEEKRQYLEQLNADLGNQLVNTFSNLGDYIKEIKIQDAKLDIANAMDEAGAGEFTNVTEALQNTAEKQFNNFDAGLSDAEGKLYDLSEVVGDFAGAIGTGFVSISAAAGGGPVGWTTAAGGFAATGALIKERIEDKKGYSSKEISDLVNTYLGSTDSIAEDLEAFEKGNEQEYEALESFVNRGIEIGEEKYYNMEDYFQALQDSQEDYTKQSEEFAKEFGNLNKNAQTRINNVLGQVKSGTLSDEEARKQIENILTANGKGKDSPLYQQLLGNGEGKAKLRLLIDAEEESKGRVSEVLGKILNAYPKNGEYEVKIVEKITQEKNGNYSIEGYNLTSEQWESVFDIQSEVFSEYGQEAGMNFLNSYFAYLDKYKDDEDKQQDVAKALGSLFAAENAEAYRTAEKELNKLGIDITDIEKLYIRSGKAGQLGFSSVADAAEKLDSTLEQVSNIIDDITKGISGELDLKGLSTLLNNFDNLSVEDFSATTEGFKLNNNVDFQSYLDSTFDVYTKSTAEAMAQSSQDFLDSMGENSKNFKDWKIVSDKALEYSQSGKEDRNKIIEEMAGKSGLDIDTVTTFFNNYADQYQAILLSALAKEQKAIQQRVDAAEKELEIWKNIVSLIESFDRWANFENISNVLGLQKNDYQAAIDAKINPTVSANATNQLLGNITAQMAANLAEQKAAQSDTEAWANKIKKDYSKYLTIGEDGNIQYTKGYYDLANKVKNGVADKKEIEQFTRIKEEVDKVANKYTEAYDKMIKSHTEYIKSLKEVRDKIKLQYQNIATMESKILDILQANDQKELDNYKKNIDKKKAALQEYLDSVQDAINKERSMRDLANQEEDLRQKERKLSILQMDTSGLYAGDIASLQKEISTDRQSLQDSYVDQYMTDQTEQTNNLTQSYDNDIMAWEEYLEWKKQDMTDYQAEIDNIIQMSQEQQIAWYQKNSEEFKLATDYNKETLRLSFEEMATDANASIEIIQTEGFQNLLGALQQLKIDGIDEIDSAINIFAENAKTSIGGHEGSIASASRELNTELNHGKDLIVSLNNAWEKATIAANNYYRVLSDIENIDLSKVLEELTAIMNNIENQNNEEQTTRIFQDYAGSGQIGYKKGQNLSIGWAASSKTAMETGADNKQIIQGLKEEGGKLWVLLGDYWFKVSNQDSNKEEYEKILDRYGGENRRVKASVDRYSNRMIWTAYKSGGYVDYTGPAWVDGTPSKPEAFLNAQDTANIAALVETLQYLSSPPKSPNYQSQSNTSNSQNTYQIEINIGELGENYTVDDLMEEIGNKIYTISNTNKITRV